MMILMLVLGIIPISIGLYVIVASLKDWDNE